MKKLFRRALNWAHLPGWRGRAAQAYAWVYTEAVALACRLRGVRVRVWHPGQISIIGPRYGVGQAVWADYIGLAAKGARQRALAADQAAEFWARREGRALKSAAGGQ